MSGCDRASDLSALLDEALPDAEARALEEHVAGCAECQGERDALALVRDQLRGLPRATPPAHLAAAVMAGVLADAPPAAEAPPGKAPASGGRAPKKLGPFPVRPKISERRAAPPPPPPKRAPVTCADVAEDLGAAFDDELRPEARARVDLHVAGCPACQQLRWQLDMLLGQVRLLPRAAVPAGFAGDVLARLEVDERLTLERERQARAARARWWTRLGAFAQAAGLLFVLGAGVSLTAPPSTKRRWAASPPSWGAAWSADGLRREAATASDQKQRPYERAAAPAPPPLAVGAVDATVVLRAPRGVETGYTDAMRGAQAYGRVLGERLGPDKAEVVVAAASNRLDDLVEALDRTDGLDATPEARATVERVSTDLDRLTLANGFVLVGRVEERGDAYVVTQGDLQQVVPRRAVAAKDGLERAARERTVRVVVEGRP